MLCGRWETYPREFAKCRRCRKAKYCGKECQSTAWSEGHRFWCSAKEGDEEAAEPADQQAGTMHPEVVVADEAHEIPPPGMTMTAGGTRAERRAERDRERHMRERALATIAAGAEATQAARVAAFRNAHNANSPTATLGHHTPRATATAANRPLLAPPGHPWPNRPTLPYVRPTDNPDSIGRPPPAPRGAFNPYYARPPNVNLDRGMSPARRRAETMSAVTVGLNSDFPEVVHRSEISRYFPGVHDEDAGPSRAQRREDHDMSMD